MPAQPEPASRKRGRGLTAALAWLLLGLICASPSPAMPAADGHIPAFDATYRLTRNGLKIGEVRRTLRRGDGDSFVFESVSRATGLVSLLLRDEITERSRWTYDNAGNVRPLHYVYHQQGGHRERRAELDFDWGQSKVRNLVQSQPWSLSIEPGTQDKLGYQLALMQDLLHGRREVRYPIADGGKLKRYLVKSLGEEVIETPLGPLRTVQMQRMNDTKRETKLWCAERLHYLPVRITHREKDGSIYEMLIESLAGIGPANPP